MQAAKDVKREAGVLTPDTFIERLAEKLGAAVRATTIFAEPVEREGVTVIPVAKARWGFGGGAGRKGEEDGGGGAQVNPVGFIELREGGAEFRPIRAASTVPWAILGGLAGLLLLRGTSRRFRM